jgi:hypothetical protein
MSFLTGQTKEMQPGDIIQFRKQLEAMLSAGGAGGASPFTGPQDISAYQAMFKQNRGEGLAQAKEQAGNLTGSGLGNVMGAAAGRSIFEENAFLADLLNRNQQANSQRWMQMAGMIPGAGGQMAYQPGFLDNWFQMVGQAGPAIAMAAA